VRETPPVLWTPDEARVERAAITRYARWLAETRGVETCGYDELWRWSVSDIEAFWASVWAFFDVQASQPYERVLGSRAMPGAEWFPGARLNYAEHVFRARDPAAVAVTHASELRPLVETTWADLHEETRRFAAALRRAGVGPGDCVVGYLPNIVEAVVAFHACAGLGATWSSCSPDFGLRSVVDRFAQIEPRILLTVDGYRYGGRDHDRLDVVRTLQQAMPSLERTIVLGYLDPEPSLTGLRRATSWRDFVADGGDEPLSFAQVPFDHPLWVLYSSGTTGLPKAIVHGHGGILLELLKTLAFHADVQEGDRLFWFTTTGWMMWNFLNGGLLTQGSIVLYDGNPGHPDLGTLWDLAEQARVTCFGTSASFIAACAKDEVVPREGRDLSRLQAVGSTGSPLSPEGFDWVYDRLGPDVWLFSTSGGTDLCTAFVGSAPDVPVWLGELSCRSLGAAVHAFDEAGKYLQEALRTNRALGNRQVEGNSQSILSELAWREGKPALALSHAQAAYDISNEIDSRLHQTDSVWSLGNAELALGHPAEAASAFERSETLAREIGLAPQVLNAIDGQMRVALARGDAPRAQSLTERLLAEARAAALSPGQFSGAYEHLIRLTLYRVRAGHDSREAARLLAEAHALLMVEADRIHDPDLRKRFLSSIAEHREIVERSTPLQRSRQ